VAGSLITDSISQGMVSQLRKNRSGVARGLATVGSGLRITKAADDAAGRGVAEKIEANHRSNRMAIRNANDGLSLLSTAEGAGREVQEILKRMRELAVQASSEVLATTERQYLDVEWRTHEKELDRLANTTEFNGKKIANRQLKFRVQVGAGATANDRITISGLDLRKSNLIGTTPAKPLGTLSNARGSLQRIDLWRDKLNKQMSTLGAQVNRLESAIGNLEQTVESGQAAHSRIVDTDFAQETATLAKNQIMQQASVAALSQRKIQRSALGSLL
jgi:flagellin